MVTSLKFFVILVALVAQPKPEARVTHLECPQYPELARQAQIEGSVRVHMAYDETGHVVSAVAITGHQLLRKEAEENIATWVFETGREGVLDITYEFHLEEPKVKGVPPTKVRFDLPDRVEVVSHPSIPIRDTVTIPPRH